MADKEVTLEDIQNSLKDIKKNLRWLYDIINRSIVEGSRTVDWMVLQIENQDTQIKDNDRDLYDLMGNIGYMKDDLTKLVLWRETSYGLQVPQ